jgi:hypothetical protein
VMECMGGMISHRVGHCDLRASKHNGEVTVLSNILNPVGLE